MRDPGQATRWDGELPGVAGAWVSNVESLPSYLAGAVGTGLHFQARPGALLRIMPRVASYLVTRGATIEVAADERAHPADVMSCLLGAARGALIHQRGELPLHATTVVPPHGSWAVAISGESGMGKSTLAAAMVLRGWTLLADDLTRITWTRTAPLAWPSGIGGIKLTTDAIRRLGIDGSALFPVAPAEDKMFFPTASRTGPVDLAWVISLNRSPEPQVRTIAGARALALLSEQTFRRHYVPPLGVAKEHLRMVAWVASKSRLACLSGAPGVEALADNLAALMR